MDPVLMGLFSSSQGPRPDQMRVVFDKSFTAESWEEFELWYRERIKEGFSAWEIDLTQVGFFSSMMLGCLIGFNTLLAVRQGKLQVRVRTASPIAQLLALSRVDRILTVTAA